MPQIATFRIGDEIFGVNILLTKEIGKISEITNVPGAPEYILGLMNLRGQIVTIMDPGVFLDQKSQVSSREKRLIILKKEDELDQLRRNNLIVDNYMSKDTLAIVADSISDVIEIESEGILPVPANLSGSKKEIVLGVIQQGEELIILLAINKLAEICIKGLTLIA